MKGLTPHLTFMSLICQCNQVRVPHLLSPRGKSAVAIDQSESMIAASVSAPSLLPRSCRHLDQWFPPSSLEENLWTIQPTTNALLYARVLQCLKAYFCNSPGRTSCSGRFLWITYLCLGLWTFFRHFFYHILANLWLASWTVGANWSTRWKTPTNPKSLATFSHTPAEDFCGLLPMPWTYDFGFVLVWTNDDVFVWIFDASSMQMALLQEITGKYISATSNLWTYRYSSVCSQVAVSNVLLPMKWLYWIF